MVSTDRFYRTAFFLTECTDHTATILTVVFEIELAEYIATRMNLKIIEAPFTGSIE